MTRLLIGAAIVIAAMLAAGGYRFFNPKPEAVLPAMSEAAGQDQFAQDRDPVSSEKTTFDGSRAKTYLEEICKIGPRMSGTEGMKKQQELVKKHFEAAGAKVEFQRFSA